MRTKRKTLAHLIDKSALDIIDDLIPKYWTIREYKPDYGIDLAIELFEQKEEYSETIYDTLGEHIYIQVKGKKKIEIVKFKINIRSNVELGINKTDELFKEIDVVKFQLDTVELKTIERMSYAVPVLLFVVDTENSEIYYICLNDYIDKILIHEDEDYHLKKTKTIIIPCRNKITTDNKTLLPLMFYAKRPKMFAFFNKVIYQFDSINYNKSNLESLYPHFAKILLRYDIWEQVGNWAAFKFIYENLKRVLTTGNPDFDCITVEKQDDENEDEEIWESPFSQDKFLTHKECKRLGRIHSFWSQMANLQQVYEETCREWFLPTYFNELINSDE